MSDQDDHDYRMSQRKEKLAGTRKALEDLLKAKKLDLQAQSQPELLDPIEAAMKNNRGLTREEAEEMATKLGF
jgi:hypothetical protein